MLRAVRRLVALRPLGGAFAEAAPLSCLAGGSALQQLDGLCSSSCGSTISSGGISSSLPSRSFASRRSSGTRARARGASVSNGAAAPPSPAQAAAADRLLELSRSYRKHAGHVSDSELLQRIVLLLQLGFSEAAIAKHIMDSRGGPYVAWCTVAELVALLQREGFSQKQLNSLLAGSGTTGGSPLSRATADVAANLRWLRETFGLSPAQAALACRRKPALLTYSVQTLQSNWTAIVERWQLPDTAMVAVAAALRRGGAMLLYYDPQTVTDKVAALQALLGLSDAQVAARFGRLASLLGRDITGLEPHMGQLLDLTGLLLHKLAPRILACPGLLLLPKPTLRRNYDAILAAVGDEAAGKLLISRRSDVLAGAVDRVERNLQTLRAPPFGCSAKAAVDVLLSNSRLAALNLERPAIAARMAYWQQAYACASAEAALLKCANLMDHKLSTVAPRVAYWRDQHPGRALLCHDTFTASDATFCSKQRFQSADFQAFKQRWLASEEGRAVCRHEHGGKKEKT